MVNVYGRAVSKMKTREFDSPNYVVFKSFIITVVAEDRRKQLPLMETLSDKLISTWGLPTLEAKQRPRARVPWLPNVNKRIGYGN